MSPEEGLEILPRITKVLILALIIGTLLLELIGPIEGVDQKGMMMIVSMISVVSSAITFYSIKRIQNRKKNESQREN